MSSEVAFLLMFRAHQQHVPSKARVNHEPWVAQGSPLTQMPQPLIGVLVPLLRYFANLSNLIDTDISNNFYYLFTCVNIIVMIYSLTTDERLPRSTSKSSPIVLVNYLLAIYSIL